MSLANKLSVYILLLTIAIFCAIGAVFLRYGAQREERLMSLYATLMVNNSVEKLDGEFSRVEEHLATSAQVALKMLDHRAYLKPFVECIMREDSLIMGGGIALQPGLFPMAKDSLTMEYVYRDKDGNWQTKHMGDSIYDYTRMDWYTDALAANHAVWSEPYFDKGGGDAMMVTCSYPLRDEKGKPVGVLTADISLGTLSDEIARLRPIDDSYAFILSDKGKFVAHPDQDLVLYTNVFDYSKRPGYSHIADIGKEMLAQKEGTKHVDIGGEDVLVVYGPISGTGWSICSVCSYDSIMARLDLVTVKAVIFLFWGLVILTLLIRFVILYSMKPLVRLTEAASKISAGDLNVQLPEMKPSDSIGRLNNAFAEMQRSLRLQMDRLVETTRAKEHIESELHIARNIQMGLVPHTFSPFPEWDGLDLYAVLRPAKEVGGDLYDFFIRDSKLFFTIGDVSGKGVPASLFMAETRTLFRITAGRYDSAAEIAAMLNDTIIKDNDSCMFVTMFIGVLDLTSGELRYCSAGHNPGVIASDGTAKLLAAKENIPIGVIPEYTFEEDFIKLQPSDMLFLYTDGLTEAENVDKHLFGEERMLSLLAENSTDTTKESVEYMEATVEKFVKGEEQSDDLTILCLRLLW